MGKAEDLRIVEEIAEVLPEYGSVPVAFEVKRRYRVVVVSNGLGAD